MTNSVTRYCFFPQNSLVMLELFKINSRVDYAKLEISFFACLMAFCKCRTGVVRANCLRETLAGGGD
ncbi:MAG: hypothetical protein A2X86_21880 [Bdellovibrionales bacterium GWA2_49_15]|nr:MAG: hypothetical protein A2X86_21880 [Bdellovibrionales bacterium GWA2_49_15]